MGEVFATLKGRIIYHKTSRDLLTLGVHLRCLLQAMPGAPFLEDARWMGEDASGSWILFNWRNSQIWYEEMHIHCGKNNKLNEGPRTHSFFRGRRSHCPFWRFMPFSIILESIHLLTNASPQVCDINCRAQFWQCSKHQHRPRADGPGFCNKLNTCSGS